MAREGYVGHHFTAIRPSCRDATVTRGTIRTKDQHTVASHFSLQLLGAKA